VDNGRCVLHVCVLHVCVRLCVCVAFLLDKAGLIRKDRLPLFAAKHMPKTHVNLSLVKLLATLRKAPQGTSWVIKLPASSNAFGIVFVRDPRSLTAAGLSDLMDEIKGRGRAALGSPAGTHVREGVCADASNATARDSAGASQAMSPGAVGTATGGVRAPQPAETGSSSSCCATGRLAHSKGRSTGGEEGAGGSGSGGGADSATAGAGAGAGTGAGTGAGAGAGAGAGGEPGERGVGTGDEVGAGAGAGSVGSSDAAGSGRVVEKGGGAAGAVERTHPCGVGASAAGEPRESGGTSAGTTQRTAGKRNARRATTYVLQAYVAPALIAGRKFHIRALVVVVGTQTVAMYRDCRVLLATKPFTMDDMRDPFVHATNCSVQRRCQAYDDSTCNLSLRDQPAYALLFRRMGDIVKDVFRGLQGSRRQYCPLPHCHEVFGFDFMVEHAGDDTNSSLDSALLRTTQCGRVLLLEVNPSPSMELFDVPSLSPLLPDPWCLLAEEPESPHEEWEVLLP